jgi:hypothetical protein
MVRIGGLLQMKNGTQADIATVFWEVAISVAWQAQELSPMALRPDLAIGLPLSICRQGVPQLCSAPPAWET